LAVRSLVDPGDSVWVEDPGYLGARFALRAVGATLIPVPVDQDGMLVGVGMETQRHARAAYVTPSHQFPTGAVMSMRRRIELLS
ncbi:PLP-dependent aminotransferase family protein, partial [Acinetobacter baumannii]